MHFLCVLNETELNTMYRCPLENVAWRRKMTESLSFTCPLLTLCVLTQHKEMMFLRGRSNFLKAVEEASESRKYNFLYLCSHRKTCRLFETRPAETATKHYTPSSRELKLRIRKFAHFAHMTALCKDVVSI